jgi:Ni,Fe-hydrogenase I small subunit
MFVTAQTCAHPAYERVDYRPIHEARRCTTCQQQEFWRADLALWVDASATPVSAVRSPAPPPRAA